MTGINLAFFKDKGCNTDIDLFINVLNVYSKDTFMYLVTRYYDNTLKRYVCYRDLEYIVNKNINVNSGCVVIDLYDSYFIDLYDKCCNLRDSWVAASKAYAWLKLHNLEHLFLVDDKSLPDHIRKAFDQCYSFKGLEVINGV